MDTDNTEKTETRYKHLFYILIFRLIYSDMVQIIFDYLQQQKNMLITIGQF